MYLERKYRENEETLKRSDAIAFKKTLISLCRNGECSLYYNKLHYFAANKDKSDI